MLKTLDILIGLSTVMLLFSMAVTVVTQFINQIVNNQGRFLRNGLAGLLRQLDPSLTEKLATNISTALLKHPLIADTYGRIGSVIQRQELTALLMELASAPDSKTLGADAKAGLIALLKKNGIDNPEDTIGNIRDTAMHLEATHPELASDVRQSMAILKEARTDLVGKLNAWFDQTIDRVSQKFTHSTRWITLGASLVVAVSVQLDVIALVDRLSLDDSFRGAATKSADDLANVAAAQQAQNAPAQNGPGTPPPAGGTPTPAPPAAGTPATTADARNVYYTLLSREGLIVMPTDSQWREQWDVRKIPGILLGVLLLSLGAPFWYNTLKKLLQLKPLLTQKDDQQRADRQSTQQPPEPVQPLQPAQSTTVITATPVPVATPAVQIISAVPESESGDLNAIG